MKDLKDLAEYVNPRRLKRLRYFFKGKRARDETHAGRLYNAVLKGELEDDKTASELLFGKAGASHYYKVKHELRQELLNTVLLIDSGQKERGVYYSGFLRCRKELYAAEVLWVEGHVRAAISVLRKLLPYAKELEFPGLVVPILERLRSFTVAHAPNQSDYDSLQEDIKYWTRLRSAEERIKELLYDMLIEYALSAAPPEDRFDELDEKYKCLLKEYDSVDTVEFLFSASMVKFGLLDGRGLYQEALEVCWDGIRSLELKAHVPRGYIRNLLMQVIGVSIRIRSMYHGRRAVIQALRITDEGDGPWFRINQLYFYVSFRSGEYQNAVALCNRMLNHPQFSKLGNDHKERWYLLRAYLSWLLIVNEDVDLYNELSEFRLRRFLNNVPGFIKDKMGFNVPVLIIQVLWLLQKKQYLDVRNRLESLMRYSLRYLAKTKGLLRTYYFIKLLSQLNNSNFRRSLFVHKAAPYLAKMSSYTVEEDLQSVEVEIIVYEDLYKYTLRLLDENMH